MDDHLPNIPLVVEALTVTAVDGEVFLENGTGVSMTAFAARETAKRLVAAADELEPQ